MMPLRAIILDFDGVLAESNGAKTAALERVLDRYPEHRVAMMKYHGVHPELPRRKKVEHLVFDLLGRPNDAKLVEDLLAEFGRHAAQAVAVAPDVPGARPFLEEFSTRVALYVASVTPQDELRRNLHVRGMDRFVRDAFGDPPTAKAEAIRQVLEREHIEPPAARFVGDSRADLEAAASRGVPFLGRDSGPASRGLPGPVHPDLFSVADALRPLL